ncbi:MAG: hypothetical protein U0163_08780 [Gemmatimonadaceae bacterium]
MQTYDALAKLQQSDPRLRIHAISTATHVNMAEIKQLTTYLYDRCPQMDHHNLAIIRGDRKNPTLQGPQTPGVRRPLSVHPPSLGATRAGALRRHGRTDVAVGESGDGQGGTSGRSVPCGTHLGGGLREW